MGGSPLIPHPIDLEFQFALLQKFVITHKEELLSRNSKSGSDAIKELVNVCDDIQKEIEKTVPK